MDSVADSFVAIRDRATCAFVLRAADFVVGEGSGIVSRTVSCSAEMEEETSHWDCRTVAKDKEVVAVAGKPSRSIRSS